MKSKPNKKLARTRQQAELLHIALMLGLLFNPEGEMFHLKVC
jgi:hypothetical protein